MKQHEKSRTTSQKESKQKIIAVEEKQQQVQSPLTNIFVKSQIQGTQKQKNIHKQLAPNLTSKNNCPPVDGLTTIVENKQQVEIQQNLASQRNKTHSKTKASNQKILRVKSPDEQKNTSTVNLDASSISLTNDLKGQNRYKGTSMRNMLAYNVNVQQANPPKNQILSMTQRKNRQAAFFNAQQNSNSTQSGNLCHQLMSVENSRLKQSEPIQTLFGQSVTNDQNFVVQHAPLSNVTVKVNIPSTNYNKAVEQITSQSLSSMPISHKNGDLRSSNFQQSQPETMPSSEQRKSMKYSPIKQGLHQKSNSFMTPDSSETNLENSHNSRRRLRKPSSNVSQMVTIPEDHTEEPGSKAMRSTIQNQVAHQLEQGSQRQLSTSRVELSTNKVIKGSTSSKNKKAARKFYVESISNEWNIQSAQLQGQSIPMNELGKKLKRQKDIKTPFEEYKTAKVKVDTHHGFHSSQQVSGKDNLFNHSIDETNVSLPSLVLPQQTFGSKIMERQQFFPTDARSKNLDKFDDAPMMINSIATPREQNNQYERDSQAKNSANQMHSMGQGPRISQGQNNLKAISNEYDLGQVMADGKHHSYSNVLNATHKNTTFHAKHSRSKHSDDDSMQRVMRHSMQVERRKDSSDGTSLVSGNQLLMDPRDSIHKRSVYQTVGDDDHEQQVHKGPVLKSNVQHQKVRQQLIQRGPLEFEPSKSQKKTLKMKPPGRLMVPQGPNLVGFPSPTDNDSKTAGMFVSGLRQSTEANSHYTLTNEVKMKRYQFADNLGNSSTKITSLGQKDIDIYDLVNKSMDQQYNTTSKKAHKASSLQRMPSPKLNPGQKNTKLAPLPQAEYSNQKMQASSPHASISSPKTTKVLKQSSFVSRTDGRTTPNHDRKKQLFKDRQPASGLTHAAEHNKGESYPQSDYTSGQEETKTSDNLVDFTSVIKQIVEQGKLDPNKLNHLDQADQHILNQLLAQRLVKSNAYSRSYYEDPVLTDGNSVSAQTNKNAMEINQLLNQQAKMLAMQQPLTQIVNQYNITINQSTAGGPTDEHGPSKQQNIMRPQKVSQSQVFNERIPEARVNMKFQSSVDELPLNAIESLNNLDSSRQHQSLQHRKNSGQKNDTSFNNVKYNTVKMDLNPNARHQKKANQEKIKLITQLDQNQKNLGRKAKQMIVNCIHEADQQKIKNQNDLNVAHESEDQWSPLPMIIGAIEKKVTPIQEVEQVARSLSPTKRDYLSRQQKILPKSGAQQKSGASIPKTSQHHSVSASNNMPPRYPQQQQSTSALSINDNQQLHPESQNKRDKLDKALYKPVIGVENGGRMNIAPALVRACSDANQKDVVNGAQFGFLNGSKIQTEKPKTKHTKALPVIVNPMINYPSFQKLPFMSECHFIKKVQREKGAKIPEHVLLITFDGVIGSYFSELFYDAKGNLFPEHSKMWQDGLISQNLYIRTGVSEGLKELHQNFRIIFLLKDNGKKSRIGGIKKALKNYEIPYDAIYGVRQSKYNYFSLKKIKSAFGVTSSQIVYVSSIVSDQAQNAEFHKPKSKKNAEPADFYLFPLTCQPREENVVILGVPHLRSEISEDVWTEDQIKRGQNKPQQLLVCDFKAISHAVLNFINIAKSYQDEAVERNVESGLRLQPSAFSSVGSQLKLDQVKSHRSSSNCSPFQSPKRKKKQQQQQQAEVQDFYSQLLTHLSHFNQNTRLAMDHFEELFSNWDIAFPEKDGDKSSIPQRPKQGNEIFKQAFDKAKKYGLFSLTYKVPRHIFKTILYPELEGTLMHLQNKIFKCKESIKIVKARIIRLQRKEEEGMDNKNDNSTAKALRYDNMRRLTSHASFQQFQANWLHEIYSECNIKLPLHPTIEQLQKLLSIYQKLQQIIEKIRDPYKERTYHIMVLQSELFSQTNLILAHKITTNKSVSTEIRKQNNSALQDAQAAKSRNESVTQSVVKKQGECQNNNFNILQWMSVNHNIQIQIPTEASRNFIVNSTTSLSAGGSDYEDDHVSVNSDPFMAKASSPKSPSQQPFM